MTLTLLRQITGPEWRAHPWRQALAVLAVALGVALAFSVHLINNSALDEFAAAARAAQGQPDLALACVAREGCDDSLAHRLAVDPAVQSASPVIEIDSYAQSSSGARVPLRLLGIDALVVATVAPELLPRPAPAEARGALVDPEAVFLNAAAMQRLGLREGERLAVQHGLAWVSLRVAGSLAASGAPLAVIDVAGAQRSFGFAQRVTRIDLRLASGADVDALVAQAGPGWRVARADDSQARLTDLSRAYRVNLTVLALVALVVGAFLVFSVLALSVAQRTASLALLGVLGLAAHERARLVLAECALVGVLGSALGLALGTALAQFALQRLGGDLGGGYFPGVVPTLKFSWPAALGFGASGLAAALAGGWLPSRQAAALAPAQALKGLGGTTRQRHAPAWTGPALLLVAGALAFVPPIAGLPLAAYTAVALLLLGGIACVPAAIDALLGAWRPGRSALALLAVQRARHERDAAAVAVAGVVASLALAIALTVMVASFRDGVARWLDQVLPADLYVRSAVTSSASDQAFLDPTFIEAARRTSGVARIEAARLRPVSFDPRRPAVTLIARSLQDPSALPLLAPPLPVDPQRPGVFVSEAMQTLYDARPGSELVLPLGGVSLKVQVRGVWRDYARQFGVIAIDLEDYRRATGDSRLNDLAVWLAPGADVAAVQRALREHSRSQGPDPLLDFASTTDLRVLSLEIFDRSFIVTIYLQAVAIAIGLAGIAASFSAQVLARRREFGLLAHLGLTRAQLVRVVALEAAVWTGVGALVGLALGLAIAVVLVHVVNPQSFHWTMELRVPAARIGALLAAVLAAGVVTATLAARALAARAGSREMVAAVKEDW